MMGEYFKGGRRKIGIVVLAFSMAFMGMWLRSISETDIVTIPIARLPLVIFISRGGSFALTWADASPNHAFPGWNSSSNPISFSDCGYLFDFSGGKREWQGHRVVGALMVSFMAPSPQPAPLGATIEAEDSDKPSIDETTVQPDTSPLETAASDPDVFVALTPRNATSLVTFQSLPQSANGTAITTSSTLGVTFTGTQTSPAGPVPFTFTMNPPRGTNFSLWAIPYWAVVTGLTLLAAYLLLSKPRATKPAIGA